MFFFLGGVLTFFSALLLRNSTVKGSNLPQFCKKIFFLGKNSSDVKTSDVVKPDFGGSFSGFGKTILLTTDPRFWGVFSFSIQGALPLKKVSRNKWHWNIKFTGLLIRILIWLIRIAIYLGGKYFSPYNPKKIGVKWCSNGLNTNPFFQWQLGNS